MKRIVHHALFWPSVTLALLLVASSLFNASFLTLAWRDGHLYGSVIDILNRAAPLMVVSLGMTLVIAVRGLDISVGAVVAIAAAVAALMIFVADAPVRGSPSTHATMRVHLGSVDSSSPAKNAAPLPFVRPSRRCNSGLRTCPPRHAPSST